LLVIGITVMAAVESGNGELLLLLVVVVVGGGGGDGEEGGRKSTVTLSKAEIFQLTFICCNV
jgi:hypothetical protein